MDFMMVRKTQCCKGDRQYQMSAQHRAGQSVLWRNLTRGDSLEDEQMSKHMNASKMSVVDRHIVERVCVDIMHQLGYKTTSVGVLSEFTKKCGVHEA